MLKWLAMGVKKRIEGKQGSEGWYIMRLGTRKQLRLIYIIFEKMMQINLDKNKFACYSLIASLQGK